MRISDWSSDVCSSDLINTPWALRSIAPPPRTSFTGGAKAFVFRVFRWTEWTFSLYAVRQKRRLNGCAPARGRYCWSSRDRKSVVSGKSVSVRVDLGGRRFIKKKNNKRK